MPKFYFKPTKGGEDLLLELTSTESISISRRGVATSSPVEDGSSLVDNFYLDNAMVTFNGLISNIRSSVSDTELTVEAFLAEVSTLRKNKTLLTVVSDKEVVSNCLITNLSLNKDKSQGLSGWKCGLTFKEIDISERARQVTIKEPQPSLADEVATKRDNGNTPTKQVISSTLTADLIGFAVSSSIGGSDATTN